MQIPVGRLDVRVLEVLELACGTTNMIKYAMWLFFFNEDDGNACGCFTPWRYRPREG